jgi:2-iminobutanoate/2-iminopropanoate deaminase
MNLVHDIGVASLIGKYSDAVEVSGPTHWLLTSGTPGLRLDGTVPDGITAQAELVWAHIVVLLAKAGMTVHDLVKTTHYLTQASDIVAYAAVRGRFLHDARPASMLLVVPALVRPEFLLEVEVIAARA